MWLDRHKFRLAEKPSNQSFARVLDDHCLEPAARRHRRAALPASDYVCLHIPGFFMPERAVRCEKEKTNKWFLKKYGQF
jgi:hypothetical protein